MFRMRSLHFIFLHGMTDIAWQTSYVGKLVGSALRNGEKEEEERKKCSGTADSEHIHVQNEVGGMDEDLNRNNQHGQRHSSV